MLTRHPPRMNLTVCFCCLILTFGIHAAHAQKSDAPFPTRPVRLLVTQAAGGPTDVIARITGQDISAALGQTVVVENRAGANAQIATELVARMQDYAGERPLRNQVVDLVPVTRDMVSLLRSSSAR